MAQYINLSQNTVVGGSYIKDGYIEMSDISVLSIQFTSLVGTNVKTLKVFASNQDDGYVATACTYNDVTTELLGTSGATTAGMYFIDTPIICKYLQIQVSTAAGGASDNTWKLYVRGAKQ